MAENEKPKVTKEMIEGKQKVPAGYELKKIHHDEYTYKHPTSGKNVTVKAHDEHVLVPIKKEVKKPAKSGTNGKPAVEAPKSKKDKKKKKKKKK